MLSRSKYRFRLPLLSLVSKIVSFWREEMESGNFFYVRGMPTKRKWDTVTALQSHGSCRGLLSWCRCVTHTGGWETTKPSIFDTYLNTEVSEFQIQLDLLCLWILSLAVITSLLHWKGEKKRFIASQIELLWHDCISVNESQNWALTFTWNR